MDDPREAAARYRVEKELREAGLLPADDPSTDSERGARARVAGAGAGRAPTASDRAAYIETAIQQAIRRGEFDDLPGAGKPLEGLGERHDADWWIRRKIETEQLRGLGPPALMLRVENEEFDERVDALAGEADVREYVEDFNKRVIEARRQLLGGPPVVTPTRDADEEVAEWSVRREARRAGAPSPRSSSERSGTKRRRPSTGSGTEDGSETGRRRRGLFRRARP